ncbi:2-oxo-4-hydroxy-4-carboxy-5-ureidoimidazoline decarboxylase [Sulfitobacter sp. SK011]|uniref:2-oxo-4-hydroxy-4-carboxy-5-ureidoimidazoline decarboxylase n=1 Tax=Sulfitobacter sp. SK011 TaxID=1389004 RepID=UPI000E0C9DF8|nr:2-oxo-4-hydroxy-4-carboxy-5-ureidoimidazoline decarboxylase [Sulfitobacter sp. SK011]AXI43984.1 OHCU decarboxylase [Sulfitobacter sp. SK011]
MALDLQEINEADEAEFVVLAEFLVENSPWVLTKIARHRPFVSASALCDAIETEIRVASSADQLRLFLAHPELAGAEAQAGTMTTESTGEQGRLGLTSLSAAEHSRLKSFNAEYLDRFGFPFIVALRHQTDRAAVFELFERRLRNTVDEEIQNTISEIMHVVRGRADRIKFNRN